MEEEIYDFVIMGSGLGGLETAYILADEGYKVVVLEKNRQPGGSLQVFSRNKRKFDTGVHYIGGLDEGQNLYQFFKYFGIMDHVKFKKLDLNGFDKIKFKNDEREYSFGQGYDNFKRILKVEFPNEEKAIDLYCDKIQEIVEDFPLYNLRIELDPNYYDKAYFAISASSYLKSITTDKKLQNVLAGSIMLYAGVEDETPLYVHALVMNSYIKSAYRCEGGGSKIAVYLAKKIRHFGSQVILNAKVSKAVFNDKEEISSVVLEDGREFKGKNFISNIAPKQTIDIVGAKHFKKAYVNRLKKLSKTSSSFSVHLSLKPNSFKYLNHNLYYFREDNVWQATKYNEATWPTNILVSMPFSKHTNEFTDAISLITYMDYNELKPWHETYNLDLKNDRGQTYKNWKKEKEEYIIDVIEKELFPGIKDKIEFVESSTPLTYRDYIGNTSGSMYGTAKNYNSPVKSFLNTKTKVPNLFLTGQYLNLHGVLGVTVSAFLTCFEFIDREKLINKVKSVK